MIKYFVAASLIALLGNSHVIAAQTGLVETRSETFRDADWRYIELALNTINQLTQINYGSSLQQTPKHDLPLLQRLLDDRVVRSTDRATLQAMGIAMGEVLRQQAELEWRRYIDEQGISRALALKHSDYTLFPITMISRRASVGLSVDVSGLYQKALDSITAYQEQQRQDYYDSL